MLFLEAIDVILLHSSSTQCVLNRKVITKEYLFKYLHNKKVPVTAEFTKQLLIEKILQYWKQSFYLSDDESAAEATQPKATVQYPPREVITETSTNCQAVSTDEDAQHFPINQMARNFANWFYEKLNSNQLQTSDFWCSCKCTVEFLENQQCIMNEQFLDAQSTLEFCQSLLSMYNLYFNLNLSHSGTQGRIDCHGLVLVLTCGTLHKVNQFVGTFEAVFGLSRDPFSENNWKMNQLNFRLHNFSGQQTKSQSMEQPTLVNSNSIIPLLNLSMPSGDEEFG